MADCQAGMRAEAGTAGELDRAGRGWRARLGSARVRRLAREGAWLAAGQAAGLVGLAAGVRLLTGLMSPSAYGELALAMTAATLTSQVLWGPLANAAGRYYAPAREAGQLPACLAALRRLLRTAAVVVVLAGLAAAAGLALVAGGRWLPLGLATLGMALCSGGNTVLNGLQTAARHRAVVAVHQALEPWVRAALAAACLLGIARSSTAAAGGYAAALAVVLGSQALWARLQFRAPVPAAPRDVAAWRGRLGAFSWPFAAWGLFTWAHLASDRWALSFCATTREVGQYAVLYQLGYTPIAIAAGMTMQFVAPILFQQAGDAADAARIAGVTRRVWILTGAALGLTGLAVLLAALAHGAVFRLLAAPEYRERSGLLPWLALAGGLFAAGQVLSMDLLSRYRLRALLAIKIATALAGLLLNLAAARRFGVAGVAGAGVVFAAGYLLWMTALVARARPPVAFSTAPGVRS